AVLAGADARALPSDSCCATSAIDVDITAIATSPPSPLIVRLLIGRVLSKLKYSNTEATEFTEKAIRHLLGGFGALGVDLFIAPVSRAPDWSRPAPDPSRLQPRARRSG